MAKVKCLLCVELGISVSYWFCRYDLQNWCLLVGRYFGRSHLMS
jgi:hypothetical protein